MRWNFAPIHRLRTECLLQRIGVAVLIFLTFGFDAVSGFSTQPNPSGFGHWIDFSFLSKPAFFYPLYLGALICLVLYIWNRLPVVSRAYLLFFIVGCGTLANSQGRAGHSTQILGLILFAQLLAYVKSSITTKRGTEPGRYSAEDLAVHYSAQMITAVYVTSGISKMIKSGGLWIAQLPNISVQILKTHGQQYINTQNPEIIERGWLIAEWISNNPNLVRTIFGSALYLELFAFLALLNRPAGIALGAGLWIMHSAIAYTMELHFSVNQWVILLFLVNVPFLIAYVLDSRIKAGEIRVSPPGKESSAESPE